MSLPFRRPASRSAATNARGLAGWRIPAAIAAACVVFGIAWAVFALAGGRGEQALPQTYADPEYGFSFQYPGDWQATKRSGSLQAGGASVSVVDPDGTKIKKAYADSATVLAASGGADAQPQPSNAGVDESVAELRAQYPDARVVERLHPVVIAGKSAWSWTLAYTQLSIPLRVEFCWLVDSGTVYGLSFKAAEEHWPADRQVFDSILASFAFSR